VNCTNQSCGGNEKSDDLVETPVKQVYAGHIRRRIGNLLFKAKLLLLLLLLPCRHLTPRSREMAFAAQAQLFTLPGTAKVQSRHGSTQLSTPRLFTATTKQ
jgi:hypothetical protein